MKCRGCDGTEQRKRADKILRASYALLVAIWALGAAPQVYRTLLTMLLSPGLRGVLMTADWKTDKDLARLRRQGQLYEDTNLIQSSPFIWYRFMVSERDEREGPHKMSLSDRHLPFTVIVKSTSSTLRKKWRSTEQRTHHKTQRSGNKRQGNEDDLRQRREANVQPDYIIQTPGTSHSRPSFHQQPSSRRPRPSRRQDRRRQEVR